MSLALALQHIYPGIDLESQCILVEQNGASVIHSWNYHLPQPSDIDIASALDAVAAAQRSSSINALRLLKEQAPIEYDNKQLDADDAAIKNINGKILELESKQALGIAIDTNALFWRDANNTTHVWSDVTLYLNWLRGLAIAIAERTSVLYYIAWQKKSDSSDIEAGW